MKDQYQISQDLVNDLKQIIDNGRQQVVTQANSALVLVYWQIGRRINKAVLGNERADYGKAVVKGVSVELVKQYGKSFQLRNLRRMMQFATEFPDFSIVSPLVTQLSWTHFITLLPLKTQAARMFYAQKAIEGRWSKRELIRQINFKGNS